MRRRMPSLLWERSCLPSVVPLQVASGLNSTMTFMGNEGETPRSTSPYEEGHRDLLPTDASGIDERPHVKCDNWKAQVRWDSWEATEAQLYRLLCEAVRHSTPAMWDRWGSSRVCPEVRIGWKKRIQLLEDF